MKIKTADGVIRNAMAGDKVQFRNGSVIEVQKSGAHLRVQPKGKGKKQRRRPPKQTKKVKNL
jgi:hypothetical protein